MRYTHQKERSENKITLLFGITSAAAAAVFVANRNIKKSTHHFGVPKSTHTKSTIVYSFALPMNAGRTIENPLLSVADIPPNANGIDDETMPQLYEYSVLKNGINI